MNLTLYLFVILNLNWANGIFFRQLYEMYREAQKIPSGKLAQIIIHRPL